MASWGKRTARKFELPAKLDKLLAALAHYYGAKGRAELQRVVVNAKYRVQEEYDYDNWNGGQWGHAIFLQVPSAIFFAIFDDLEAAQTSIREDLNRLANVPSEHIAYVSIELLEDSDLDGWREKSGALVHSGPAVVGAGSADMERLWKPGWLRVFLTHKANYKKETSELKAALGRFGVACFVAHEDIEPTKEWQQEIERALFSMEVLFALMTPGFHESNWTDQEMGVAIGRRVPIVPIRLGVNPYGLVGKYQALAGATKTPYALAKEVYELLWKKQSLSDRLAESLVIRFEESDSFEQANRLMLYLERVQRATPNLIDRLEKAPTINTQVESAFEVQAKLPGLIARLRGSPAPGSG